jgi:hypothetical protein
MRKLFTKFLLICLFVLMASVGFSDDFYVNFDTGDDDNAGTSIAPWKHCPGDAATPGGTVVAAKKITGFSPGDTIYFAGGVVYYGTIVIPSDGDSDDQLVFKGDGWGVGKAIIDGSGVVDGPWTVCPNATACFDNTAHYTKIYTATAPADLTFYTPLFQGDEFLSISQSPNPADPFYYLNHGEFHEIPTDSETHEVTLTSVTDPDVFDQTDSSFWDDAFVMIYKSDNTVDTAAVTSFDPDTDTISFASVGGALGVDDGNWQYSITNNPSLIDTAGEFAFVDGTMYLWAFGTVDPDSVGINAGGDITAGVGQYGFRVYSHDYITIEGFELRRFWTTTNANGGCCIRTYSGSGSSINCIIQDNDGSQTRSWYNGGIEAGMFHIIGSDGTIVRRNTAINAQQSAGILLGGPDLIVDSNVVTRTSGQGIYIAGAGSINCQITNNVVSDINGSHANGITAYTNTSELLIANNHVSDCAQPMTMQDITNVYIIGNFLDANGGANNLNIWGSSVSGTKNLFLNNTLVNNVWAPEVDGKSISGFPSTGIISANNVIDGGGSTASKFNNLYVGLNSVQTPLHEEEPPNYLHASESYNTDLTLAFVDPAGEIYTPKSGGFLINNSYDASASFPTTEFPAYNFYLDLAGNVRPDTETNWEIGAYEYVAVGGDNENLTKSNLIRSKLIHGGLAR